MDPVTCGTCLTLNPPDAPACVRCNSALVPSTPGSPVRGSPVRGAAPPRPAAQTRPAPEPDPAPPPRPPRPVRDDRLRELTPADRRRIVRRIEIVGAVVILLVLVVGGVVVWRQRPRDIDGTAVAAEIGSTLSQQLGQQVRVECPGGARRRAGTTFRCTATDAAGDSRTVVVTVTGDDGAYRWQLR
jgi:uncharacterized protein DUF4333